MHVRDRPAAKQIESITDDFRQLRKKIDDLIPKARTQQQIAAIESLSRAIGGVRGCELGIARQSFGLDRENIDLSAAFKKSREKR